MSVFSGDFLGFRLGDVHSSSLNITRVSNGNRYQENLIPSFNDSVAAVPGGDGNYYWDTFYTQRPFSIDFAFDDLRDEDIRRLRQIFGFKGVKELVFDEYPYKKYMVKCSSPPNLKYIAFDLEEWRVYKGEGAVNLVAYYPYGISTWETVIEDTNETKKVISNVGDIEMPFQIIFPVETSNLTLELKQGNEVKGTLKLENVQKLGSDAYYCIDMRTNLVEGLDVSLNKTGNLYNRFITSGDFFKVPVGIYTLVAAAPWKKLKYSFLYY